MLHMPHMWLVLDPSKLSCVWEHLGTYSMMTTILPFLSFHNKYTAYIYYIPFYIIIYLCIWMPCYMVSFLRMLFNCDWLKCLQISLSSEEYNDYLITFLLTIFIEITSLHSPWMILSSIILIITLMQSPIPKLYFHPTFVFKL